MVVELRDPRGLGLLSGDESVQSGRSMGLALLPHYCGIDGI